MFLYTSWDVPFSCPCFWSCYCKHQIDIDTHVGSKHENFCSFKYMKKKAKTGDIYAITTAGHWGFGPVWNSCQRRHNVWSHIGICYVKDENYTQLAQEFIDVIEANPKETLFTVEAALAGCVMNPLRPVADNLFQRMQTGYMTIMPVNQAIRDRTPDLDQRFIETVNMLADGTYQFNPCQCMSIVWDVWPCGCACDDDLGMLNADAELTTEQEFDGEGVCTEYGYRIMKGLGYFERHESDTRATAYLKEEMALMVPEEIICNDLLNQTYIFDKDEQMIICGDGWGVRADLARTNPSDIDTFYSSDLECPAPVTANLEAPAEAEAPAE